MINLTVINIKQLIRILLKTICMIIVFVIIFHLISKVRNGNYIEIEKLKEIPILECVKIIDDTILLSKYYNNEEIKKESGIKKILSAELAILANEEELMEKENQEELEENENTIIKNIVVSNDEIKNENTLSTQEVFQENNDIKELPTEIIKLNNKVDKYTDIYKTVKIKNESKYPLTEEILTPNVDFKSENIIIYHTHTCESYTQTEQNKYNPSGNFRTTDLNYNVARVGSELSKSLKKFGLNVVHNTTLHDYPAYTGSYTRSLSTIKNITSNSDSELIIDLHRDALGNDSNYGPTVRIGEEIAAQLMFVIGTDGGGLEHPNWKNNLKLAIKIQEKANEMYPGLFKPIILRNSRYNQHVSGGACIIEVGATGNTIEQCIISMKYLSNVINQVIKK